MNKLDFKPHIHDPNTKYLSFQPRLNSRPYNKSKSNKKPHINKNIISPCEPLADKLLRAVLEKNQRKIPHNKREKTQESMLQTSMTLDGSRCFNHPDKKGDYFIESQPGKKFCLKCNLTLSAGDPTAFITNEKIHKKQILDGFKGQLAQLKEQIQNSKERLQLSIQKSQEKFAEHSSFINESFISLKEQIEQKRRQMLNGLILAQQNLKITYEQNMRKVRKMCKTIERYEFDIKKFYDEIIDELPKCEFDQIMKEYEDKINKNFKSKLRGILCSDGVCVYIPNLEIKAVLQKSSVQFYLPVAERDDIKEQNRSFYGRIQAPQLRPSGSNSLDSKINEFASQGGLDKKPIIDIALPEKKRHNGELGMFERRTGNFVSPRKGDPQHKLIQDKENINLQNFAYDFFNPKQDQLGKFTFKP